MRVGRALPLIVAGVVLVVATLVVATRSRPAADFAVPAPASAPSTSTSTPIPAPTVSRETAPVRLRIAALDLNATVDAVGVDPRTGDFAVPPSVDRVGWYKFGPGFAATAGSIVIAGHVDSAAQGEGAFFGLGELRPGDVVTLTGPGGGRERVFEVTARQRYRKTAIPLDRYFARDGEVRLTLITCGGPFDAETRHYRDNVVVTAVPA
ncbi:class F sortase [Actinoplanes sp. LDG1-06]|uniref:Class F sortase n=1 Tax=Paractinoplanes ovalisporus TaxID=2810368 RepID=A0ABS2A5J3_9ACTN|nr:class F sortase [Actinoplanes ovalisporus]MBM2615099.1 class F sortase [Actinoplanes ovalisporus]